MINKLTTNQIMLLLCKVIKHSTLGDHRKAQMYAAPLIRGKDGLTSLQFEAVKTVMRPIQSVWTELGVKSRTSTITNDSIHVRGSSMFTTPSTMMAVVGYRATLSLRGIAL